MDDRSWSATGPSFYKYKYKYKYMYMQDRALTALRIMLKTVGELLLDEKRTRNITA